MICFAFHVQTYEPQHAQINEIVEQYETEADYVFQNTQEADDFILGLEMTFPQLLRQNEEQSTGFHALVVALNLAKASR